MKKVGTIVMVMLLATSYGLFGKDKEFTFNNKTKKPLRLAVIERVGDFRIKCKGKVHYVDLAKSKKKKESKKSIETTCCISRVTYQDGARWRRIWRGLKCSGTAHIIEVSDGYKLVWE